MPHPLVTGTVETPKLAKELGFTPHEEDVLKVKVNRKLYDGDHWLSGLGYIGAPPDDEHDKNAPKLWARLRRSFASYNATKEITDRLVGVILGSVPDYGLTVRRPRRRVVRKVPDPAFIPDPANPNAEPPMIDDPKGETELEPLKPEEEALIEEAAAALEIFYSSKKPLRHLKKLFRMRLLQGRAYLRLHVPPKFRNASGRVARAADLNAAVERIFLTEPEAEDAVRLTDEETRDELSIYRYKRGENNAVEVFELCFTDDDGRTYIATIEQRTPVPGVESRSILAYLPAAPAAVELAAEGETILLANVPDENISDPLDLNGHLNVYEMSGEPLITEQVRSQNASLNLNLTMSNHVTVESGFREIAVTNVELETEKVKDSTAPGGVREVPKKLKRGAGVIHNFVGIAIDDGEGNETLSEPDVYAFDPVPLESFDKGQTMFRRNILAEVHQLWALITGDAAPSGESRIQAMADFIIFALDFQEEVEDAGTWLFEAVLYWAAWLAGRPGAFNGLRVNFRTRLYLGRLSADEKRLLMEEVAKRLRSRENYMLIAGDISDPREEKARIEREEAESIEGQRARLSLEADRQALDRNSNGNGDAE